MERRPGRSAEAKALLQTLVAASASSGRLRSGEGAVISSNPGIHCVVVLKPQPWDQPTSRHSAPVPVKGRRSMLGKRAEPERCRREIAQ